MSELLDIFSKSVKTREEKTIDGEVANKNKDISKILIDYREKNSLVASELIGLGLEIEFRNLNVADYIIENSDIAIERKTVSDFISSMINKRLLRQLQELQQYPNRLLIIEGLDEQELYNDELEGISGNAIRGFLLTILLRFKVPIIFSQNYKDTAKFIYLLAKKQEKEANIRANKKVLNIGEQQQFILEGFPGIGAKTAKKLLNEFKTIHGIFNAPEEELKKILGKKTESFIKIINAEYKAKKEDRFSDNALNKYNLLLV